MFLMVHTERRKKKKRKERKTLDEVGGTHPDQTHTHAKYLVDHVVVGDRTSSSVLGLTR
jgi:hypothetical protein